MTVTSTVPDPAGTVTVSVTPPALTRRPVAARAPKQTARTLLRSRPLMTARVPGAPVCGDRTAAPRRAHPWQEPGPSGYP